MPATTAVPKTPLSTARANENDKRFVATVTATGLIHIVGKGTAQVKAKLGGITATVMVTGK